MGRTIHYSVFGSSDDAFEKAWRRFDLAQHMMNHHFTWTCEDLGLRLFEEGIVDSEDRRLGDRLSWGFTKVRDDEWNAALVVAFLRWVSTELPGCVIRVYDEGDFIRAGHVLVKDGRLELDTASIEEQRAYLLKHGYCDLVDQLAEAVAAAKRDDFFAPMPISEYANRSEIRRLQMPEDLLEKRTVTDVLSEITFPWQTEWLDAA